MTKQELIKQAAKASGVTQETAAAVINAAFDAATAALLQGESVTARGFGTLERRQRNARTTRDLNTGDNITIPAGYNLAFTTAQTLKDKLNGKGGSNEQH